METYTFLREFADSWVLLALTLFFIGAILWAFRPGAGPTHAEAANIPFRNDTVDGDEDCAEGECKSNFDLEAKS